MSDSFDFPTLDHFTTGTIGPVGQRVFYLQGRQAAKLVTLRLEKEHVRALAEYLAILLAKLPADSGDVPRDLALLEPVAEAWTVGSLAVGYEEASDRVLVVATEQLEEDAEVEAATARFQITRGQASAFVERSRELIEAGRPLCRICGRAIDPGGHICPRSNGHGRG